MLVRGTCQPVVQVFEMQGGKVAVAVEGVEMRAEAVSCQMPWAGMLGPLCLDGDFTATMLKRSLMLLNGSWAKIGLREPPSAILQEDRHFCLGIALSHVGDVDTLGGIGSLLQGFVRSRLVAHLMDEDVRRSHLMGERCHHLASVVAQVYGDVYRILWHRHEEYVFEALGVLL